MADTPTFEAGTSLRKSDREERILAELLRHGKVSVDELAELLGTAPANVRRDINRLVSRGLALRTRGGATVVEANFYQRYRYDSRYSTRAQHQTAEKRRIGVAAAALIQEGEMIGFTAGTTTAQVARSIRGRQNIRVVTNAINIAMELCDCPGLKTFVTGGLAQWTGSFSLVGQQANHFLGSILLDRVFVAVCGIDPLRGATINEPEEAVTFRTMIDQARQVIVVSDSSKIGILGPALVCPVSKINMLITDTAAPNEAVEQFEQQGCKVVLV